MLHMMNTRDVFGVAEHVCFNSLILRSQVSQLSRDLSYASEGDPRFGGSGPYIQTALVHTMYLQHKLSSLLLYAGSDY